MKRLVLSNPILVGRANELSFLYKSLDSVVDGKGQTIFISGEAGSGKTRLVNEFLNVARQREINVLYGWCLSNAGVPYFPFVEAFSTLYSNAEELFTSIPSQTVSQIDRLAHYQTSRYESEQRSPQAWMDLTFASVTKELLNLSTKKPALLILEDIHWADSASLALLHYISRLINSERVLVLATFRGESLRFDLEGQPLPLVQALRTMNREDLYTEMKLPSLDETDVGMMAASMLGGHLQAGFLQKLSAESHGNPLFIVESLRMLINEGSLIEENGQWRPLTDRLTIPAKVRDIILQRVGSLKLKQRKILDVASVLGDKFDYRLIASVLHQEQIQILEKLNAIARTTSLIKYEDGSYLFDHAKSREVVYEDMPDPLKIGYHSMIAERLETFDKKSTAEDLAYHYEKAGNEHKALLYSLLAGKEALGKFSNLEAKKYFSYVLNIAEGKEQYPNERIEAIEGLGDSFFATGAFREAEKTFETLIATTQTGIVKLRAYRKAIISARWLGDFPRSLELSKETEALVNFDRLEYARILLNKGAAMGSWGNTKEALKCLEKALNVFEEENSLADLAQGLNESASLYQTEGYPEKAVTTAKRAIALNEEIGDLRGQVDAYFYAGQVFFNYRLHKEALACFERAVEIGQKIGYYSRTAWAAIYSAIVLGVVGELNEAVVKNLLAIKYAIKTDSYYTQSQSYANLLALYSKLDNLEEAEECYSKIKLLFPDETKAGSKLGYSALVKAQALFFTAKKEWEKSNDLFNMSLDLLKGALFSESFEANTRTDYAFALVKQGRRDDAQVQMQRASVLNGNIDSQFRQFEVNAVLMIKKESKVDEEFEVKLEFVNVSRNAGILLRVNRLFSPSFVVSKMPIHYVLVNGCLDFKKHPIEPFQMETIRFSLKPTKEGTYTFAPEIIYEDKLGQIQSCKPKPVSVKIVPASQSNENKQTNAISVVVQNNDLQIEAVPDLTIGFQFKSESAAKVFDFLINSFVEDYMRLRLPVEKSGWRTSMDAVKHGKVPVSSVYGRNGRLGKAVGELQRRGLIERRFFPGERGRGGNIMRLRICYEKEPIKRQIDFKVAKDKK